MINAEQTEQEGHNGHDGHDGQAESLSSREAEAANDSTAQVSHAGSSESVNTVTEEAFRPEELTLERAQSMGYPTEQSLASKSIESNTTPQDLEKGVVAPILIQQELGAQDYEKSDVTPIPRRAHTPSASYS